MFQVGIRIFSCNPILNLGVNAFTALGAIAREPGIHPTLNDVAALHVENPKVNSFVHFTPRAFLHSVSETYGARSPDARSFARTFSGGKPDASDSERISSFPDVRDGPDGARDVLPGCVRLATGRAGAGGLPGIAGASIAGPCGMPGAYGNSSVRASGSTGAACASRCI